MGVGETVGADSSNRTGSSVLTAGVDPQEVNPQTTRDTRVAEINRFRKIILHLLSAIRDKESISGPVPALDVSVGPGRILHGHSRDAVGKDNYNEK
jgi:hypothetical protein